MISATKRTLNFTGDILDWTFPVRRQTASDDYIVFQAKDPATGKLRKKKYSLRKYPKGMQRDTMAAQMTGNILNRLQQQWNPFVPDLEDRSGALFTDVCEEFRKTVDAEVRKGIKKEKTRTDYFNRLKLFRRWAVEAKVTVIRHCTVALVDTYLQGTIVVRDNSARTRNNHRTFLSAFFGWCVKRHYLASNPCASIGSVKTAPKLRQPLTHTEMKRLQEYLGKNDRHFLLAVMMQYYTLIRPKELSYLRLRDISVSEQTVVVPRDISKNGREEAVALNDRIVRLMLELDVFGSDGACFLFGKGFRPSEEREDERIFRDRWKEIRTVLHFPADRKFYSLKDTGIIDLIAAEGAVNARDQARHSSISVTNLYSKAGGEKVHEETKHFKGSL